MNSMQYAPVVLFVYNRPTHTQRTLESINRLAEAPFTDLYIYADQAKSDKSREKVELVRSYIHHFAESGSSFRQVHIIEAECNKGLAASIIDGVTDIISQKGSVIVLEDDLEVSDDFLRYMNAALNYYKNNSQVWAISGYTFPMASLKEYQHDVYFSGRGCSWGWATWQDRWQTVDWNVSDYATIKYRWSKRRAFARWGNDLPTMLDAYMLGSIHSWAIRWCYAAFNQQKYTVYPVESKVVNSGIDGSGTNFKTVNTQYETYLGKGERETQFIDVIENEKIRREFSRKYLTPTQWMKVSLVRFIQKIMNVKQ